MFVRCSVSLSLHFTFVSPIQKKTKTKKLLTQNFIEIDLFNCVYLIMNYIDNVLLIQAKRMLVNERCENYDKLECHKQFLIGM